VSLDDLFEVEDVRGRAPVRLPLRSGHEVWAEQAAKGMKPQVLPKTLEIAGEILKNTVMLEVGKKLIVG
jgi:hypothetical protein